MDVRFKMWKRWKKQDHHAIEVSPNRVPRWQKSKTDQNATAWGTEGLVLTKCKVWSTAKALLLDILVIVSLHNAFLVDELKISLWSLVSLEMTSEGLMSSFLVLEVILFLIL